MFLTQKQIAELTGKRQRRVQARVLNGMGIQYKTRADGSLAVLESHIEKVMGGSAQRAHEAKTEPNWGAVP
jgi:hypothetical protein